MSKQKEGVKKLRKADVNKFSNTYFELAEKWKQIQWKCTRELHTNTFVFSQTFWPCTNRTRRKFKKIQFHLTILPFFFSSLELKKIQIRLSYSLYFSPTGSDRTVLKKLFRDEFEKNHFLNYRICNLWSHCNIRTNLSIYKEYVCLAYRLSFPIFNIYLYENFWKCFIFTSKTDVKSYFLPTG